MFDEVAVIIFAVCRVKQAWIVLVVGYIGNVHVCSKMYEMVYTYDDLAPIYKRVMMIFFLCVGLGICVFCYGRTSQLVFSWLV